MARLRNPALIFMLCAFMAYSPAAPVSAGEKEDKEAARIERLIKIAERERAEQIERNIRHLKSKTHDLKREIKNENIDKKDTVGRYTKRVDDEYLEKLKKISLTGNKQHWREVHAEYRLARKSAMERDKQRKEKREEKKPNPYLKPLSDPWDRYD